MVNNTKSGMVHLLVLFAVVVTLSGCILTGSDYTPMGASLRTARSADGISIVEGDMSGRKYVPLGKVEAYARSVNLWSSDPTRADIDEELRAQAAKIGADAIINVKYHSERQGLASRGKMTAEGLAIAFTN